MKNEVTFTILSFVLCYLAMQQSDWGRVLYWPAVIGGWLALGYWLKRPAMLGKRADGTLHPLAIVFLAPYLILYWFLWHLVRWLQIEPAFNWFDDRYAIGRRCLLVELPLEIDNVVDFTAEMPAPAGIVDRFNYLSFPILDGSTPSISELEELSQKINSLEGKTFLHCAQGHGRTGFIMADLLLRQHPELSVKQAMHQIKTVRPALACNDDQLEVLRLVHETPSNEPA